MVAAQLGCEQWHAFVASRGGATIYAELPWATLQAPRLRVLNDSGEARIVVGLEAAALEDDTDCQLILERLKPWKHEIHLWRGDNGSQADWVGVPGNPKFGRDTVEIPCLDLSIWFERRTLPTARSYTATDLATIFAQYASDALSRDTSPNITVTTSPTSITGDRDVTATNRTFAMDEMRELSRSGVDWTMLRRELLGGGVIVPAPQTHVIIEDFFLPEPYEPQGLATASEVWVRGEIGSAPDVPILGHAGGVGAETGLIERVFTEGTIKDVASANANAQTRLDLLSDPPGLVSGRLLGEAPIQFGELVPGRMLADMRLRVGVRRITGEYRLLAVGVAADRRDNAERITCQFEPIGTV